MPRALIKVFSKIDENLVSVDPARFKMEDIRVSSFTCVPFPTAIINDWSIVSKDQDELLPAVGRKTTWGNQKPSKLVPKNTFDVYNHHNIFHGSLT